MRMRWHSRRMITPAEDQLMMLERFPRFRHSYNRQNGTMTWTGCLHPTDSGRSYEVQIILAHNALPRVIVRHPVLRKDAPHRYGDGSLCLYYPDDSRGAKWHCGQYIARTIVPWTAEWLYFYEIWLETNLWLGTEAPHPQQEEKEKR